MHILSDARLSRAVASVLERKVFIHEDMVIWHGEQGTGMYFIAGGNVEVLVPQALADNIDDAMRDDDGVASDVLNRLTTVRKGGKKGDIASQIKDLRQKRETAGENDVNLEKMKLLTVLGSPSFFGEMALLNEGGTAVASVRVKGYCETHTTSRSDPISCYSRLTQPLSRTSRRWRGCDSK